VTRLLGHEYRSLPEYLHLLGAIGALRGAHTVAAAILAGADQQPRRTIGQIASAFINLGLNLWWIPRWGWRGAAYSSIVAEAALACLLWGMIRWQTHLESSSSSRWS
jgi:O-antigen/teichoic acid export membrane protein